MTSTASTPRRAEHRHAGRPAQTPASSRPARFIRLEKAVSIPDKTVVNLARRGLRRQQLHARDHGLRARSSRTARCASRCRPTSPSEINILDANGRRLPASPTQGVVAAGAGRARWSPATAATRPATAASPISHGRDGLFASALGGRAPAACRFPTPSPTLSCPRPGETMAEARAARDAAPATRPPCACR